MRFPWVSRAALAVAEEALLAAEELEGEAQQARLVAERDAAQADTRREACEAVANRLLQEKDAAFAALAAERERYAALVAEHYREMGAERERFSALTLQMVELKKQDYGPAPVIPVPPNRPLVPIPLTIAANIARVSDPETRERRQIESRVRDLLQNAVPEREIANMVLAGEDIEA